MDDLRFDALTRSMFRTRRAAVGAALAAGITAVLGADNGVTAISKKKKCRKRGKRWCNGKCIAKTKCCHGGHCAPGQTCTAAQQCCTPDCPGTTCFSDGCGGFCGLTCEMPRICGTNGLCCTPLVDEPGCLIP